MKLEKGGPVINEPFWKHPNNEKEIIMNTYIKKEDIGLTDFEIISCNGNYKMALKLLLDKIEGLPAADVQEIKHGRWIDQRADSEVCSVCGSRFYISALFIVGINDEPNFCPNCGADMRDKPD